MEEPQADAERERLERSLAERLVGEGSLTRAELARARERQEQVGGPLAWHLVALGLAEGPTLTRVGAAVLGLPAASEEAVGSAPDAVRRRLPGELVRRGLLPLSFQDGRLHLACAEPWRKEDLAEAVRASGSPVLPSYLDDASVAVLVAQLEGVASDPRLRAPDPGRPASPEDSSGGELISESAFQAIYQREEGALPPVGRVGVEQRTAVLRELAPPAPPPPAAALTPDAAPAGVPAERSERPASRPKARPAARDEVELVQTVSSWEAEPAAAPPMRPLTPVAEARRYLQMAGDRRQIGWLLARHALSRAPRVILLEPREGAWHGWVGAGLGVEDERVDALRVGFEPGSIFAMVAETGAPFLGPLAPHPAHRDFFTQLGLAPPGSAGLFPIHHRGRTEMAVWLDGGPGQMLSPDVSDVLLVAQAVPPALDRLEREREESEPPRYRRRPR